MKVDHDGGHKTQRDSYNSIVKYYMPSQVHQVAASAWQALLTQPLLSLTNQPLPPGCMSVGGISEFDITHWSLASELVNTSRIYFGGKAEGSGWWCRPYDNQTPKRRPRGRQIGK